MGDLRNKIAKIERSKAEMAAMEAFLRAGGWKPSPPAPTPQPIRCGCGRTHFETEIVVDQVSRRDRVAYYCERCAPDDIRKLCWPDSTKPPGQD